MWIPCRWRDPKPIGDTEDDVMKTVDQFYSDQENDDDDDVVVLDKMVRFNDRVCVLWFLAIELRFFGPMQWPWLVT